MSKAGALCVMTLVEMRSAPVDGVARRRSRASRRPTPRRPRGRRRRATHFATSSGVMLSSITRVGAAVDGLDHLLDPLALDFDAAARPPLAGAPRPPR